MYGVEHGVRCFLGYYSQGHQLQGWIINLSYSEQSKNKFPLRSHGTSLGAIYSFGSLGITP